MSKSKLQEGDIVMLVPTEVYPLPAGCSGRIGEIISVSSYSMNWKFSVRVMIGRRGKSVACHPDEVWPLGANTR